MRPVKRRILCVEDNAEISEMLAALFAGKCYEAVTAATVADASGRYNFLSRIAN